MFAALSVHRAGEAPAPTWSAQELLLKVLQDGLCLGLGHHRRKRGNVGVFHSLQAAEVLQQPARGALSDSGYLTQFSRTVAHLTPLAVEGHGKTMGFVTDQLHQ